MLCLDASAAACATLAFVAGTPQGTKWRARRGADRIALSRATFLPAGLSALTLLAPLILRRNALPIDYDEGVYSAAAQALARGEVPYRDFVLVHPPGLDALLAPVWAFEGFLKSSELLLLSRLLVAGLVVVTAALLTRATSRNTSLGAGLVAGLVFASWPAAVVQNRSVFTEPVANFFLVVGLWAVWRAPEPRYRTWVTVGGLASGLAVLTKLPAAPGALAVAIAVWATSRCWSACARFCLTFLIPAVVLVTYLLATGSVNTAWTQIVRAQLGRSGTGAPLLTRLVDILAGPQWEWAASSGVLAAALMILLLVGLVFTVPHCKAAVIALVWLAGTILVLLTAASWWQTYALQAVPAIALGVGVLVGRLGIWLRRRSYLARLTSSASAGVVVAIWSASYLTEWRTSVRASSPFQTSFASTINSVVTSDSCVFSFDPGLLLAAGLPPIPKSPPIIIDPYGMFLVSAVSDERELVGQVHERVDECSWVLTVGPGYEAIQAWVEAALPRTHREVADGIWERREP